MEQPQVVVDIDIVRLDRERLQKIGFCIFKPAHLGQCAYRGCSRHNGIPRVKRDGDAILFDGLGQPVHIRKRHGQVGMGFGIMGIQWMAFEKWSMPSWYFPVSISIVPRSLSASGSWDLFPVPVSSASRPVAGFPCWIKVAPRHPWARELSSRTLSACWNRVMLSLPVPDLHSSTRRNRTMTAPCAGENEAHSVRRT